MLMQEPGHRLVEMAARILPLLYGMGGPGIGHHREVIMVPDTKLILTSSFLLSKPAGSYEDTGKRGETGADGS